MCQKHFFLLHFAYWMLATQKDSSSEVSTVEIWKHFRVTFKSINYFVCIHQNHKNKSKN